MATLLCATAAGCGTSASSHHATVASRVCSRASHRAAALLAVPLKTRVSNSARADIECVVSGAGTSLDVVAQASAGAWMIFDGYTSHQSQVYGSGTIDEPQELPHLLAGLGFEAAWIPAQGEMLATNGTQSRGGSYVTVTVSRDGRGGLKHRPSTMALALAVTRATIAAAPRGPNPGPPPA